MPRFNYQMPSLATTILTKMNRRLDETLVQLTMREKGVNREVAEGLVQAEVDAEIRKLTNKSALFN